MSRSKDIPTALGYWAHLYFLNIASLASLIIRGLPQPRLVEVANAVVIGESQP